MLPLQLKMSAFCSYLHETVIDFTVFGRKGLYLITGDTGAGKTTIFDAISYALYGEASGDLRDPKLFRSKNALPEQPTFVELTFLSKGEKYTIRRSPEYERPSKRGGGMVKNAAETILTTYRDDVPYTKVLRRNDDDIHEIIGIDVKKFKQLSMIAQGAFMRVLNADTNEKTELLRAIFGTERFKELEEELKRMADDYKQSLDSLSLQLSDRVGQIQCADNSASRQELLELQERSADYFSSGEAWLHVLAAIIAEDSEAVKKQQAVIEQGEKALRQCQTDIGSMKERAKTRQLYLDTKARLTEAQRQLPEKEQRLRDVQSNEEKAAALEGEAHLLQEKLPGYDKLDSLQGEYAALQKQCERAEAAVRSMRTQAEALRVQLADMKKESEELRNSGARLATKQAEFDRSSDRINRLRQLLLAVRSADQRQAELPLRKKEYLAARAQADRAQQHYLSMNRAFLDEQAGIIAETLQDGQPCPVCGSAEHPHIAVKRAGAPSKEAVEKARTQAEEAGKDMSDAAAACSAAEAAANQAEQTVTELARELYETPPERLSLADAVTQEGKRLKEQNTAAEHELSELKQQVERQKQLDGELPQKEQKAEQLRSESEKGATECAVLRQKLDNLHRQQEETARSLPFAARCEAEQHFVSLQQQASGLRKAQKEAEKACSDCRVKIRTHQEALNSFGEEPQDEQEKIRQAEAGIVSLQNSISQQRKQSDALSLRISANKAIQAFVQQQGERLLTLRAAYLSANQLSATANGRLTDGQEKLTLEVFAQRRYFDSILTLANHRLRKMSNGKYEFRRADKALEKRGRSGLDIDVLDHDSATLRSVRSLSGGESFMASLSLALGFSDVIQSAVGGVHLDTMFIDEGFGTLDEKALENAYHVFSDLSQEGSCLVGIISHVEDLKTRITNRIVVTKDASGNSHARVESDRL